MPAGVIPWSRIYSATPCSSMSRMTLRPLIWVGFGWTTSVLNWINNSISVDLHQVFRERGCTARHLQLAIENQFLGNREQRILHLDVVFRTFVQGDLSVKEY
jgi:hypothetical protein